MNRCFWMTNTEEKLGVAYFKGDINYSCASIITNNTLDFSIIWFLTPISLNIVLYLPLASFLSRVLLKPGEEYCILKRSLGGHKKTGKNQLLDLPRLC